MTNTAKTSTDSHDELVEVDDLDEVLEIIPFAYDITSYGADYPVDSLVKRMESGDVIVPRFSWDSPAETIVTGFQREYVWARTKADRFIESLLLGLPVPGIFLVKEPSGRLLVLDGHQRLFTLTAFCTGIIDGTPYQLKNVQERFVGCSYANLDVEDRRRLDDSIIHATIIRQNQPTDDLSSVYLIFERLNTGGVNLQPQEIRVALYHGEFVKVLTTLNKLPDWRALFGNQSRRLKDLELILRFLAFYYYGSKYKSPMKDFLNRYMAANRDLSLQSEVQITEQFKETCSAIRSGIGVRALKPYTALNAAVADSVMVGVAKRVAKGAISEPKLLKPAYEALLKDPKYLIAVESRTAQEGNVSTRIALATKAFEGVGS